MNVLIVVYSVCAATSLGHLIALKERGPRRKNMGVGFPVTSVEIISLPQQETRRRVFDPWVRKIPWRTRWQSTLVFLPGKSHGQRSLVGYSPWGCKRVGHD